MVNKLMYLPSGVGSELIRGGGLLVVEDGAVGRSLGLLGLHLRPMVAHFVLHLLALLLGHPSELDGCTTIKTPSLIIVFVNFLKIIFNFNYFDFNYLCECHVTSHRQSDIPTERNVQVNVQQQQLFTTDLSQSGKQNRAITSPTR